ncbi:Pleckstrin homology domain-containing protein [Triangularia verruculosa]|uniref:Pleckstrin homology domain-containing protein n=1 Tax=Triangularia verruculosa TaxID=2587418 RepID=A0AAN6XP61_9PEZI|nr:Pleckstrin homology domain-containing protein [Triangularia verruculosa]
MADTTKPVEVAATPAPVAEPVVETKPAEATPTVAEVSETAPAVEATPAAATETEVAAEAPAAEAEAEEAKKEEEEEEEAKPVEEGHLEHKGQGANFPKNFLYTKTLFWFGSEPVNVKEIASFKAEKTADVAHHVTSWAAETGKGLLFYSEKGDKAAPNGAIQLAEATEPVVDGANKFHFTSKGHKHTFKAAATSDRDNWVAQLKVKIAEAKELAATVTESETYKKTLESLKPAPVKKEEKAAEPAAEAAPVASTEEAAAAVAEAPVEAAAVETPQEEAKEEEKAEKTEEVKKEEPKRRSASRKRTSIFGSLLGKKEEKKVAEPTVETPATAEEPAATEAAASTETPAAEAVPAVEAAPVAETTEAAPATTDVATTEAKPEEKAEEKKDEVAETRPAAPTKRSSIFGSLPFGKKKAAPAAETPVKEVPAATEAVAETAPVIPAVETTEPLSAEVSSPANVPTETTEVAAAPAETNGETRPAIKSDKRKSSLPFGLGKKKESASSDEEGEKVKSPSAFSKFRATIKGKGKAEKVEEKKEETPATEAVAEEKAEDEKKEEEAAKAAETTEAAAAEEEKPKAVEAAPVVTATA